MATSTNLNLRLIAHVRDEPQQMLQPICGYEKELLLSLEEACKPLEHILDSDLKVNIMIAKMNSTKPADRLSPDESASIHLYTMEWKVHESSLYAVLNRTLRVVDRRKLQPWFKYLKLFLTAIFKLPSTRHQTIYRGVPEDLNDLYPVGNEITWWSVTSCTSEINALESPLYVGTSGTRTMFHIETSSGKMIRSHSYYQCEDEILLPPGIYLKVVGKLCPGAGLNIIQLREIQQPYKMLADPFDLNQWKTDVPSSKPFSYTSNSLKKENNSSTSVTSNIFIQPDLNEEEPQITTSNKSPYSSQKLDCKGHACATCGFCRDWYWRYVGAPYKTYKKRNHVKCTVNTYSCGRGYYYYHNSYRLCECDDNHA